MFFEMVLILAMTLYGEISYNNPDRLEESLLIYQTAKNRSIICNTTVSMELLKSYQYSSLNDNNCKKENSRCLNIKKENVHLYAKRLSDVFTILSYQNNNDVLFFHAKSMTLEETGLDKTKMKLMFDKKEHLYYSSSDNYFCKAKFYITNKKSNFTKKEDLLKSYREKLRKKINGN